MPCSSQRRLAVTSLGSRQTGRACRLRARDRAISSIRGVSGKPPAAEKTGRVTNMPWSPVAMPVRQDRRFMDRSTRRSRRCAPDRQTSKRPHEAPRPTAASSVGAASAGTRVSACRNQNTSPEATRVPAFIWDALPRGAVTTRSARLDARTGVPSLLPPSTTMISWPVARKGARSRSVCPIPSASFSAGMMIERRDIADQSPACAAESAPPQLDPCPAVQP
jgi:hypothetical protein